MAKNEQLEHRDKFLNVLFFLFTIYTGTLVAIFKIIKNFSLKNSLTEITYFDSVIALILLGVLFIIGLYWLIVVFVGILEYTYYDKTNAKIQKILMFFRNEALKSPLNLILNSGTYFFLLFFVLMWLTSYILAVLITAIYIENFE